MARPYSLDLRERVVAAVAAGGSCRSVASTFGVSVASVVRWSQRFRASGSVAASPVGGDRRALLLDRTDAASAEYHHCGPANCLGVIVRIEPEIVLPTDLDGFTCINILGLITRNLYLFAIRRVQSQGFHDHFNYLVLQRKDISEGIVVSVGPKMPTRRCVYKLGVDAHLVAGTTNAAFQHVAHPQVLGHLPHRHGPALVHKCRIPGDDEEAGHPGQVRDRVFGHAVDEVLLRRVVGHVGKGQHSDGWFVRQWESHIFN